MLSVSAYCAWSRLAFAIKTFFCRDAADGTITEVLSGPRSRDTQSAAGPGNKPKHGQNLFVAGRSASSRRRSAGSGPSCDADASEAGNTAAPTMSPAWRSGPSACDPAAACHAHRAPAARASGRFPPSPAAACSPARRALPSPAQGARQHLHPALRRAVRHRAQQPTWPATELMLMIEPAPAPTIAHPGACSTGTYQ